jgi:energy-converting hydrogenase Eha subunit F
MAPMTPAYQDCSDVPLQDPTDAGPIAPLAKLTPSASPITVEINFSNSYMGKQKDEWTPLERQYICSAARRFQAVWSSEEFHYHLKNMKTALALAPGTTLTGEELYQRLMAQPKIVMTLAVSHKKKGGYAITNPDTKETLFPKEHYLDRSDRDTSLIEDLTDTLSHEFTHYKVSVRSTDANVVDDPNYVSYGIGCMTENLAVPGDNCWFDPSRPDLYRPN